MHVYVTICIFQQHVLMISSLATMVDALLRTGSVMGTMTVDTGKTSKIAVSAINANATFLKHC